jgi:hypothetical protein
VNEEATAGGPLRSLGARDLLRASLLAIDCFKGVFPVAAGATLPGGTFLVSVSALGSLAVPASLEAEGWRFAPVSMVD